MSDPQREETYAFLFEVAMLALGVWLAVTGARIFISWWGMIKPALPWFSTIRRELAAILVGAVPLAAGVFLVYFSVSLLLKRLRRSPRP